MATKYTYNEQRKCYKTRVWDGTYDAKGKKHYKELRSTKSSRDLENKVQAFKLSINSRDISLNTNITLIEYCDTWLNTYKASLRTNTKRNYEHWINTKISKLGPIKLKDLTRDCWFKIIDGENPPAIRYIWAVYSQVVRSAILDGYLPKSAQETLLSNITMPKLKKASKRALTPIETDIVKNIQLPDREKAFLWIIFGCGLRREEALALTVEDITDSIQINKVLIFDGEKPVIENDTKSHNSLRSVPMPDFLKEFLQEYIKTCDTYLFTYNGKLLTKTCYKTMWRHIVSAIDKELGYQSKLTAHIFRHNYCSILCYQIPTISFNAIAKLMGDNPRTIMDVYSHIIEEQEDKKSAIENAFNF